MACFSSGMLMSGNSPANAGAAIKMAARRAIIFFMVSMVWFGSVCLALPRHYGREIFALRGPGYGNGGTWKSLRVILFTGFSIFPSPAHGDGGRRPGSWRVHRHPSRTSGKLQRPAALKRSLRSMAFDYWIVLHDVRFSPGCAAIASRSYTPQCILDSSA